MYFAGNNECRVVLKRDFTRKEEPAQELNVCAGTLSWRRWWQELKWRVLRRPQAERPEVFPPRVPPLMGLAADGPRLITVSNDHLKEGKARLDLFVDGQHRWRVLIPMLYVQYFVFPPTFYHSSGMQLVGDHFYSLHYDEEADLFRLVSRRIRD